MPLTLVWSRVVRWSKNVYLKVILKKLKNLFQNESQPAAISGTPKPQKENRRNPRVHLEGGLVKFYLQPEHREIKVANISVSGIALDAATLQKAKPGDTILARVEIGTDHFDLTCRVIHITQPIIGCFFEKGAPMLGPILQKTFEIELRAHDLIKIRSDLLAPREDGTPYYFQGSNQEELFFLVNQTAISSLALTFNGFYLEWKTDQKLRMGKLAKQIREKVMDSSANASVDYFKTKDPELVAKAKSFIRNINFLSSHHLKSILAILDQD